MLIKVFDLVTTFFQSLLLMWICNNLASKGNRLSKFSSKILVVCIFSIVVFFTYVNINVPFANFLMAIGILVSMMVFYRKSIIDAFVGFGTGYFIISITAYFLITVYTTIIAKVGLSIPKDVQMGLFIYIPGWFIYFFVYILRRYIFDAMMVFKNYRKPMIFFFILDYSLIFVDAVRIELTSYDMGTVFKAILYLMSLSIFIFSVMYFAKVNDNFKEVELLNDALNSKNIELRKVKHDYGSEISSLYGLYQLGKIERIGELLKEIVERNQSLSPAVNVSVKATPMVSSVLNSAVNEGINVIVFDSAEYDRLPITNNDLIKLISNITKNSIDVLCDIDNPTIKYKSYNGYNGVVITISNNGNEIPVDIRNKIFTSGFSTKGTDRGMGLSIVKDILDKNNGNISIESNKEWTQFKLEIPYVEF